MTDLPADPIESIHDTILPELAAPDPRLSGTMDLRELHGGLSYQLKRYEQVTGEFPTEVLNEYRYAARSALSMIEILLKHTDMESLKGSGDFQQYEDFRQQAEHAFRCGYHDLVDGLVYELTEYLSVVTEGLSDAAIEAMGDLRNEVLDDLEACNQLIAQSRKNLADRDGLYQEIYNGWYEKLLNHKFTLTRSVIPAILAVQRKTEAEKDALMQFRLDEERKSAERHRSQMRLAIFGLILGTVLSLVALILGG
jgi:hypothetical protein